MRMRLLVLGLATACLAAPANAAPGTCRLLVDPSGDTNDRSNPAHVPALDEPAADLVSADVASNGTFLTVAVRPRAFAIGPATQLYHQVFLWVGGTAYRFDYRHDLAGVGYSAYHVLSEDLYSESVEAVPGAFGTEDTARGEIRMSIRLSTLAPYGTVRKGTAVRRLGVWTNRSVTAVTAHVVDEGTTARTYRLGDRSCVTVGR